MFLFSIFQYLDLDISCKSSFGQVLSEDLSRELFRLLEGMFAERCYLENHHNFYSASEWVFTLGISGTLDLATHRNSTDCLLA